MKLGITNVLITGVGGQGLVLATSIISKVAFLEGYDIKTSDVIGLAQRGGLIWGCVRFGAAVPSPLIPNGEGDILLAMEELEALRWTHLLKNNARIILNKEKIYPNLVLIEKEVYPGNIVDTLKAKGFEVTSVDANSAARSIGNMRVANTILLGCLSKHLPFSEENWKKVIQESVPPKTINMNLLAFQVGREK